MNKLQFSDFNTITNTVGYVDSSEQAGFFHGRDTDDNNVCSIVLGATNQQPIKTSSGTDTPVIMKCDTKITPSSLVEDNRFICVNSDDDNTPVPCCNISELNELKSGETTAIVYDSEKGYWYCDNIPTDQKKWYCSDPTNNTCTLSINHPDIPTSVDVADNCTRNVGSGSAKFPLGNLIGYDDVNTCSLKCFKPITAHNKIGCLPGDAGYCNEISHHVHGNIMKPPLGDIPYAGPGTSCGCPFSLPPNPIFVRNQFNTGGCGSSWAPGWQSAMKCVRGSNIAMRDGGGGVECK